MLKGIVSGVEKDITRIPMQVGGSYKEGWEVRDNQDRLIWGREDELQTVTGTLPFKGYGLPAKVKSLLGNTQQTVTPTPDTPIMPEFVGMRTEQLYDEHRTETTTWQLKTDKFIIGCYGNGKSTAVVNIGSYSFGENQITVKSNAGGCGIGVIVEIDSNKTYTLSFDISKEVASDTSYFGFNLISSNGTLGEYIAPLAQKVYTFNSGSAKYAYIVFRVNPSYGEITYSNIMLNAGSTALPYEPYGYKIFITNAGQTTPIYLGQTPTVRRIKKKVLTGNETWWTSGTYTGANYAYHSQFPGIKPLTPIFCTHLVDATLSSYVQGTCKNDANSVGLWMFDTTTSPTAFKAYLAAQYAAGTPVTVWYLLAEPTTGIVNEPLAKIGDYADELNDTSATLPEIPTTTGQNALTVDTTLAPSSLTVSVHAKKIHYGFKIDKSVDDSEDAVIYTHDAVTMTPAHMNFTNDRFDYGSWGNAFFVRDCYPVALNLDGTEAYRLDPDDYTKKMDGTPSDIFYALLTEEPSDWSTQWKQYYTKSGDEYELNSDSTAPTFTTDTYYKLSYSSSFTGNFMMAFPKVWFYRHEDPQYNYIEISNHRLSDDWKCYAHINANGQEVDFIYLPLFKGVIKDSKLRSLPGQIPQGNTTATIEVNAATALGSRWQIWDHSSAECINDLLTLMSKSIDSQGRFGQGCSTGYDSTDTVTYGKLQTGTLINKGKFHGYSATTKEVKVFGLEGFWANRWDRLQGMLLADNVWKIKMTPPYNFTGTNFVTFSDAEVPSGNGYLSKVQTSEYGSIPASISNGSSTKYFKDYFYKAATGTRVALRGGYCRNGVGAGFRYVYVNGAASASDWSIGASPVYK